MRGGAAAPGSRSRGAARADERDFAGAPAVLRLNVAREGQRLVQVQRRGAGLRGLDRRFDLSAVRLESRGRSGQRVGAHQHDAVARRQRAQILPGAVAGQVHEGAIAGARRPSRPRYRGRSRDRGPPAPACPSRNWAMASSSSAMLASCRISDQGCWMCLRRAATAGCSAATQKRSVETTCLRRERSSRYSATETAEMRAEDRQELEERQIQQIHVHPWRMHPSCPSSPANLRPTPHMRPLSSCDASHPDQVSEDHAFERTARWPPPRSGRRCAWPASGSPQQYSSKARV